jgi:hypothetical protein
MKKNCLALLAALVFAFVFCKKENNGTTPKPNPTLHPVLGSEVQIGIGDCAYLVDHGLNICLDTLEDDCCICICDCILPGSMTARLRVTNGSGLDTAVALTLVYDQDQPRDTVALLNKNLIFSGLGDEYCTQYGQPELYRARLRVE